MRLRTLARVWVVLVGLVILTLTVLLPFQPHAWEWHTLGLYGKAVCSAASLGALGYRYCQRREREAEQMRRLRKSRREISGPE